MSSKQLLLDHINKWQAAIESTDDRLWFSPDVVPSFTRLKTEIESCTHHLTDNIRSGDERQTLVENLYFMLNLLTSWQEGLVRKVVGPQHLADLKTRWGDRTRATLDILHKVVEGGGDQDESDAGQRTLFTTSSKLRRKHAEQTHGFDGAVFLADAETVLADWERSRSKLPNANSRNAENVVVSKISIIPQFEPYCPADLLNSLGFKATQLGTYLIMEDQLLLGLNTKWCRDENLSNAQQQQLVADKLAELSAHYGTSMVLAHPKSCTVPTHGYKLWWVISETHLNTLHMQGEVYPSDWSVT